MASTNKTSNLELSQFIATDTPTWLVDYNGDMEKIDAGVGRVEELAQTASTQAVGVASGLQTTNQTVTTLSGQVANVQNQANTTTASVNGINQRLGNADISGIGDGTITGAIISMQNSNLNETILWNNPITIPDSTKTWNEQTIAISDLSNYSYIEIYYTNHIANNMILTTGKLPLGPNTLLLDRTSYRVVTISLVDNTISFSKGFTGTTEENVVCVPRRIIGYK